jgi:hypothetical protein
MVELNFDEIKIKEVEQRLDKCSDRQIKMLVVFYKDRVAKRDQAEAARQKFMNQEVLNQAKLDLEQAKAYRDYLAREFKATAIQKEQETNLVRQNIQNQNMYRNYGNYRNGNYNRRQW